MPQSKERILKYLWNAFMLAKDYSPIEEYYCNAYIWAEENL